MMCNKLRLAVLAAGIVSFIAFAQPAWRAPTVFFDRDDSYHVHDVVSQLAGKFNQFTGSLTSFGVDNIDYRRRS